MEYTFGLLAKYHNCDLMITGHNTYNWSQSNWFFQTDDPIEKFYDKDMKFVWTPHYHLRYSWEGPVHWIFMNRETRPIGRWEIWENLPDEMKSIVFVCDCGTCLKCRLKKFYHKMKAEGFTAEKIDDEIQRQGKYGKYYCSETNVEDRHSAYINM